VTPESGKPKSAVPGSFAEWLRTAIDFWFQGVNMKKRSLLYILLAVLIVLTRIGAAQQPKLPKISPDLWQKTQEKGFIRVIVELNVPWRVSKPLNKEAELAQRQMIADTQDRVLAELARTRYKVNRRFEIVPALAMEVEPDALVILDRSPHVLKVYEDVGLSPTIEMEEVKKIPEKNSKAVPKISPELWQKAQEKELIRVIIDLDVSVQPESKLTEEGRNKQRRAIHTVQKQLLMELSSTKHEETGRLAIVPVIGLKVGLDALAILETSTLVKKVTEDKLLKSDLELREQK
jgi:hypothetical protein